MRLETMQLLRQSRVISVMVTHDPEEALFMADHIALMEKGRIVQMGVPEQLCRQPVNAFVAEFLGDVNRLIAPVRAGHARTPLGAIPAPEAKEGDKVEVLIRPQAILLATGSAESAGSADENEADIATLEVVSARLLDSETCLALRAPSLPDLLQARLASPIHTQPGERLRFQLAPEKGVFVFPWRAFP
jgi:iron(III) transport system ATP-binding protein